MRCYAKISLEEKKILGILGLNSRDGNYKQRDLIDHGLPGAELRGSLRTICVQGTRREGFGEEQRINWAQVGVVGGPGMCIS